jgi:sugar phosphate isomerase/epimerase
LPGLGDIDWNKFFSALKDVDYKGATCIEIEDKAFEESLETKIQALQISKKHISQFVQ